MHFCVPIQRERIQGLICSRPTIKNGTYPTCDLCPGVFASCMSCADSRSWHFLSYPISCTVLDGHDADLRIFTLLENKWFNFGPKLGHIWPFKTDATRSHPLPEATSIPCHSSRSANCLCFSSFSSAGVLSWPLDLGRAIRQKFERNEKERNGMGRNEFVVTVVIFILPHVSLGLQAWSPQRLDAWYSPYHFGTDSFRWHVFSGCSFC